MTMTTTEHTTTTHRMTKNTYVVNCTCGFSTQVTVKANARTGQDYGTTENHALHVAQAHREAK